MELIITNDGKYRIESLTAATLDGSFKVMRDDFFQDELVCTGIGLNKDPLAIEELLELCADAALDGVSLVAVEIVSGEVVAVIFSKLQFARLSNETEEARAHRLSLIQERRSNKSATQQSQRLSYLRNSSALRVLNELPEESASRLTVLRQVSSRLRNTRITLDEQLQKEAPSESSGKSFFETFIEERCKRPKSRAIVDFMVDVDSKCNHFERYGIDCLFELLFLGTSREHRQKGLAKLLCKTSIELAKKLKHGPIAPLKVEDLGPKYAFMKPRKPITRAPELLTAIWTADGTKKIGKDLGFDVLVTVSLKDYNNIFEGKRYSDRVGFITTCEGAALKI